MDTLDAPDWRDKLCRGLERLASAVRLLRLAPQDEAPKRQAFAEVLDDLRPALGRAPWLALDVHPYTLMLGGEVVYTQINRAESLAFRLFREGVGRLALRQDVDAERLARLADLLAVPQDVNEALGVDLVIHLWAQPLEGVSLAERPWHALRLLEPHTRDPHILKASVADALVFFQPSGGAVREPSPPLCAATEVAARWRALSPALKAPTLPPHVPAANDLRDVLQGLAGLAHDALRAVAGAPPEHLGEFYAALLRALVLFHERGVFEAQVLYLEHLSYAPGERGVFVADLLARASSPAALQRILPHLEGEAVPQEDRWICDFFVRHTRHAGADFHPLFSAARSGRAFALLAELVWRVSPAQPDAWLSLIERTSAESALALLVFLQGRADAALMEPIYRHASGHPDASLRHTTITAIPLRDSAGRVQPVLLDALRDPSAYVRVAAIRRLADSGEPALGIFLVEHLQHSSFLRAQPDEQQALLRGLLQLGQDRHTPVLLQQLDQWERGLSRPDASSESMALLKRACEQVLWALSQRRSEASFQRLYERAALAPDELFHAYQRALESFSEHAGTRARTPPAVAGRTTFLEQPSMALSFQDDPEPSLVLTPARPIKAQDIDTLLHAYLQDDAAVMNLLPEEPLPVDDPPSVPPTPPQAIEEMLREYLGVAEGERASHELPISPPAENPQHPVRAKGKLTPPPDLLLHELLDASPSPNFLEASSPDGAWGVDSAPTLLPGRAKRTARSPEDSDLPDFGLGFGMGGELSDDHAQWLDEFTDPELDDEVSSLIDDLMDEPPFKKKSP